MFALIGTRILKTAERLGKLRLLNPYPNGHGKGTGNLSATPLIQSLTDWYLSVDGTFDPASSIPEQKPLARWIRTNRDRYASGVMEESRVNELESMPFWTWDIKNVSFDRKRSIVERELSWMIDNSIEGRARSAGVTGYSGIRHQCDIVIEDHKVVIEHDGRLWHADMDSVDLDKTLDLENAGWSVIRVRESPLEHVAGTSVHVSEGASMQEIFESVRTVLEDIGVPCLRTDFDELGKVPGTRTPHYDDWYSSLEAFHSYIADGGTATPIATETTGEFKVGQWVYVQRRSLKRNKLSDDKKQLLESIPGWQWELKPQVKLGWDATYERLIEYQREHGSMPPARFACSDGLKLGSWSSSQRYLYRKGEITAERIRLLESVPGWYWNARNKELSRER